MKLRLFVIALWCCVCSSTQAQLLWKVTGNGIEKPSYIFGTHHIAPLNIMDSIAGFKAAFEATERLYGEVVMDSMAAQAQQIMVKYMMLPQDSLLPTLYTPEEYARIDELIKTYFGVGAEQVKMLKPSAIGVQIAVFATMKAFPDFNPQQQLDASLQTLARQSQKEVGGLETIEFQCRLLFDTPLKKQAENLLKTTEIDLVKQSKQMAECYMRQDLEGMAKVMESSEGGLTAEEKQALIYNRNRNWAERMKTLLHEAPAFFVVGAGHLIGKEGLPDLLRGMGYTVEAVL